MALLLWAMPIGAQTSSVTYSGQATAVRATILGISTVISDTGPLPSSGGAEQTSLLTATAPLPASGYLAADVFHATTVGQGDASDSHASSADLKLTVGGYDIAVSLLVSRALAICKGAGPSVSGYSQVVGLTINGGTIAVSGQPNQTIPLPNGWIIVNEQKNSVSGNTTSITVNALHIYVNDLTDVVISSAQAGISCSAVPACTGDDFEAGEGEDHDASTGDREDWAFAGGTKDQSSWGHLEYIDHGLGGPTVHATRLTKFIRVSATTRHIEGVADVNGVPGFTFALDATDNHKLGLKSIFKLRLSNGYVGGNEMDDGDVEIEEPCDP
jgi:hypothetical protein